MSHEFFKSNTGFHASKLFSIAVIRCFFRNSCEKSWMISRNLFDYFQTSNQSGLDPRIFLEIGVGAMSQRVSGRIPSKTLGGISEVILEGIWFEFGKKSWTKICRKSIEIPRGISRNILREITGRILEEGRNGNLEGNIRAMDEGFPRGSRIYSRNFRESLGDFLKEFMVKFLTFILFIRLLKKKQVVSIKVLWTKNLEELFRKSFKESLN